MMNNIDGNGGGDGEADDNPYLAMRRAKIARNRARLRELGLLDEPPRPQPSTTGGANQKRRQKSSAVARIDGPARRSARLSSRGRVDYREASLPGEGGPSHVSGKKRAVAATLDGSHDSNSADDIYSSPTTVAKRPAVKPSAPPAANSVRSINLDVRTLLFGKGDSRNGLLGRTVEQTGKEHVINESFSLSASSEDARRLSGARLSFNKYCGVQEWNNCAFLWVNLGTSDSPNEWLESGRRITWFGGSRMHDDSPVIRKLIRYGKDATNPSSSGDKSAAEAAAEAAADASEANSEQGKDSNPNAIILWCRRFDTQTKKFSPYVCFGRVGYRSHVPGSRPLSFVWDLVDYEGIAGHEDEGVRETFELFTRA